MMRHLPLLTHLAFFPLPTALYFFGGLLKFGEYLCGIRSISKARIQDCPSPSRLAKAKQSQCITNWPENSVKPLQNLVKENRSWTFSMCGEWP